jgi:hypothetical protein
MHLLNIVLTEKLELGSDFDTKGLKSTDNNLKAFSYAVHPPLSLENTLGMSAMLPKFPLHHQG